MATKKNPTTEDLLAGMLSDYQSRGGYVPRTTAENQARAQDEYKSYYDQLRLSAQQRQQQADLALQQQRAGLQDTYDQQREASARDYRQRYSQADRQMLSRGMQRSSYGAQVLANINQQGAEAQQRLWDAQGAAEGNIDAQRAQLAQQLGDQLLQYDASRAADVLKRTRELDDQEYERQQAQQQRNDQLGLQLASILRQAERDKISDEQFERQFGLSKQQAEAQIANIQWQQQYQTDRARAADEQAARQYALSERELEAQLANQQWQRQYQEGRAKASDEQWAKQFGLSQQQLEAQLANQQWQREYQQARDAVSDAQWQQNYDFNAQKWADTLAEQLYQRQYQEGRDAVKDEQWQKTYNLQARQAGGGYSAGSGAGSGGGSSSESALAEALRTMTPAERVAYAQDATRIKALSEAEINKALATQAEKEQKAKAKAKNNANTQKPVSPAMSTADLIKGLTPAPTPVAVTTPVVNVPAVAPTTKVLQGPVNMDLLNQMNEKSAATGLRFESELANAMKNKKK